MKRFNEALIAAGFFAAGASLMYLMDPGRGAWRRSVLRGRIKRGFNQGAVALRKTAEYAQGQIAGVLAETRGWFGGREVSDQTLRARVRSALGRAVSHPGAIEVKANQGMVQLSGPVLRHEVNKLMRAVRSVRGVKDVEDRLEVHDQAGNISALQGGVPRAGKKLGMMQEYWPPTTRLMIGAAGATIGSYGLARRDAAGAGLALLGAGLLARGATNLPLRRLVGIGAGRRAIDVQKTININAPVEVVFRFFADYANYPHFMHYVREVRDYESGRSHWVVSGPAGVNVEWDAEVTEYVPNEILAWKSIEGSTVDNAGIMRFQPNEQGGTRVDIKLSYNPPGGALGHAVAKLFGADPKSEMDQDLMRVKTLLETGRAAHDAAQPVG